LLTTLQQFRFRNFVPSTTIGPGWLTDAQRGSVDGALNGWRDRSMPSGELSLDVNVRGPRGTKVDAGVTDGDFIAQDRGITINRELTNQESERGGSATSRTVR
jgi:hypothetical protein